MIPAERSSAIEPLPQPWRIGALGINVGIAWAIFIAATGTIIPTGSGASVWFLAATAYWLLSLVAAPFFVPPRDALSSAIAVVLLLAPIDFAAVSQIQYPLVLVTRIAVAFAVGVGGLSLIAAYQRGSRLGDISYRISGLVGKGEVLFTPAVIISALGFYQKSIGWASMILGLWVFVLAVRPTEMALRIYRYLKQQQKQAPMRECVGTVIRVDDPNIVRVALVADTSSWNSETIHVVCLPTGRAAYVVPLFVQMQNAEMVGTGLCCAMDIEHEATGDMGAVFAIDDDGLASRIRDTLTGEGPASQVIGIVAEGSSIASIRFQVMQGVLLEEGMVVFAVIRGERVYYQILDASTHEETFQQNPLGVQVASATQLGCYDEDAGFKKYPWLPEMNHPLFLLSPDKTSSEALRAGEFVVGSVPSTPFGVRVVLDDLIRYHTAVLGVTGTGKTELTLDIIRVALDHNAKVFCVDLTGEYSTRLADRTPTSIGLPLAAGSDLEQKLFAVETGTYGAPAEKAALKAFLDSIKPQIALQIDEFLSQDEQRLGIFELAEITNTKATLRTTELYLSAIMDWARKHRNIEQILIVLEEAHTIIPENYSSGFDAETQWVVGRIGQIALQGRKYGVGLLLVSQRTALVSKTILSQCNTFFTHALIDKTSLDFLSSVYSPEHVRVLPNLRFLEFMAHGKAVKSERPILTRREYDETKVEESRKLDAVKQEVAMV